VKEEPFLAWKLTYPFITKAMAERHQFLKSENIIPKLRKEATASFMLPSIG
jgi:hypothetical protein